MKPRADGSGRSGGHCWAPLVRALLLAACGPAPGGSTTSTADAGSSPAAAASASASPTASGAELPSVPPGSLALVGLGDSIPGAAIAVVAEDGGEPRYLTGFEQFASAPDWGWVTDEIVFSIELRGLKLVPDQADETWDLHAIRPDGSGLRRITSLPDGGRLLAPRWSPGGSLLIAKEVEAATMTGGGRQIDPTNGVVEPFVTGLEETRPQIRPVPGAP